VILQITVLLPGFSVNFQTIIEGAVIVMAAPPKMHTWG
jgi:hypothetical protein